MNNDTLEFKMKRIRRLFIVMMGRAGLFKILDKLAKVLIDISKK